MSRRSDRIAMKAADIARAGLLEAITSGGQITYNPDGGLSFFQMFGASYQRIYRSQPALRSVVDFLSRNLGAVHMRVMHREDDVTLHEADHPAQQVLEHPQSGVPYSRLMRQIVADKAIYDVAAVWKIRQNFNPTPRADNTVVNEGRVVSLVRLPIPYIGLSQSSLTSPLMFQLRTGRPPIDIPAADVIWMPGYAPDSNVAGVPPIETLRQILAEEWAAGKDRENFWTNGVQGNLFFSQEGEGLDDAGSESFKTSWRNKYGGVSAPNAREAPLLPVGIKPETLSIDAKSAEYLATRNLAREICCGAYGIQPQLLGITASNFASMDMYHQMLYQDTLAPWSVSIQEDFEEQFLVEFEAQDSGYFIDFNLNAMMAGSFLDQAKVGQQAVGGPWMTRNEFREKFQGLPPVEGGDEIIVPLNVVLGGGDQANPQDATNQFSKAMRLRVAGEDEQ